jgi:hypothetical protein
LRGEEGGNVAQRLAAHPLRCPGLIRTCGHSYNTAGTLRAKALAEDAVRLCSPRVKAPLGLLMPGRSLRPRHVCRCALTVAPCPTNARTFCLTERHLVLFAVQCPSSPTLRAWFHLVTGDAANHDACFSLIPQSPSSTSSTLSMPKRGAEAGRRGRWSEAALRLLPGAFQNLRVFVPLCELLRTVSSVKPVGKPLTYGVVRSCAARCSAHFLSDRLSRPAECVRISVLLAGAPLKNGRVSILWHTTVRCCC